MKLALQYISDIKGKTIAVQLDLNDWEKVLKQLKKCEQSLGIESNLKEAFDEVAILRKSKAKKQTLIEFCNNNL